MVKCKHETKNGRCGLKESYAYRKECYTEECCRCHEPIEPCGQNEPQTNADRIRAMSDEELSVFLWEFDKEEIARTTEHALERRKITEWLKQPAEGDA